MLFIFCFFFFCLSLGFFCLFFFFCLWISFDEENNNYLYEDSIFTLDVGLNWKGRSAYTNKVSIGFDYVEKVNIWLGWWMVWWWIRENMEKPFYGLGSLLILLLTWSFLFELQDAHLSDSIREERSIVFSTTVSFFFILTFLHGTNEPLLKSKHCLTL